jgi:HEAT repeat protein
MDRFARIMLSVVVLFVAGCQQGAAPQTASTSTQEVAAPSETPGLNPVPKEDTAALPLPEAKPDQGEETFQQLLAAAKENNASEWSAAEGKLQQLGAAAIPTYVDALRSDDATAREMAVMLLVQLGPPTEDAVPGLTAVLDDPSAFVRVNAAAALSTLETPPPAALTTLTALMDDADETIRVSAVTSLGNTGPAAKDVLTDLARGLTDPAASVRRATAASLGRLGEMSERYQPALQRLTEDEDEGVRQAATLALKQLDPSQRNSDDTTIPASATQSTP